MLIIWLKVRGFLELEKFGESANPCATERVKRFFRHEEKFSGDIKQIYLRYPAKSAIFRPEANLYRDMKSNFRMILSEIRYLK